MGRRTTFPDAGFRTDPPSPAHIEFANGTSFHFVDAEPAEALQLAQDAAGGRDVRIGGGPSTVRQFLEADLIDFMHLVVVPVVLGHGTSPWGKLSEGEERFDIEVVSSPTGLTHQLWNRKGRV